MEKGECHLVPLNLKKKQKQMSSTETRKTKSKKKREKEHTARKTIKATPEKRKRNIIGDKKCSARHHEWGREKKRHWCSKTSRENGPDQARNEYQGGEKGGKSSGTPGKQGCKQKNEQGKGGKYKKLISHGKRTHCSCEWGGKKKENYLSEEMQTRRRDGG